MWSGESFGRQFPKQRLHGGVLTFHVGKWAADLGFFGVRGWGCGCGWGFRVPVGVAVAGVSWCGCGVHGWGWIVRLHFLGFLVWVPCGWHFLGFLVRVWVFA